MVSYFHYFSHFFRILLLATHINIILHFFFDISFITLWCLMLITPPCLRLFWYVLMAAAADDVAWCRCWWCYARYAMRAMPCCLRAMPPWYYAFISSSFCLRFHFPSFIFFAFRFHYDITLFHYIFDYLLILFRHTLIFNISSFEIIISSDICIIE